MRRSFAPSPASLPPPPDHRRPTTATPRRSRHSTPLHPPAPGGARSLSSSPPPRRRPARGPSGPRPGPSHRTRRETGRRTIVPEDAEPQLPLRRPDPPGFSLCSYGVHRVVTLRTPCCRTVTVALKSVHREAARADTDAEDYGSRATDDGRRGHAQRPARSRPRGLVGDRPRRPALQGARHLLATSCLNHVHGPGVFRLPLEGARARWASGASSGRGRGRRRWGSRCQQGPVGLRLLVVRSQPGTEYGVDVLHDPQKDLRHAGDGSGDHIGRNGSRV